MIPPVPIPEQRRRFLPDPTRVPDPHSLPVYQYSLPVRLPLGLPISLWLQVGRWESPFQCNLTRLHDKDITLKAADLVYINIQPEYERPNSTRFGRFRKFGII